MAEDRTQAPPLKRVRTNEDVPSSTSASDSASSSDASEDSDADSEAPTTIPQNRTMPLPPSDLRARLASFLPQMAAANAQLAKDREAGTFVPFEVDDDSDRPRIELDLGLGVFEERKDDDSSDAESEPEGEHDSNRLGKLMGQEDTSAKASIEELHDTK